MSKHSSSEKSEPFRVLAVDDRRDALQILGTLLKVSGYEVRTASDGATALIIAQEFCPNAILLDLGMPGMSGLQVARIIREDESQKGVVLIAMTGYDSDEDRQKSQEAGFDFHLVKPADIHEVRRIFETYCRDNSCDQNR